MTVVAYDLGRPRVAAERGGDCRARDLTQGRNVHGPHRFATTTACRISNGLLRITVGAAGIAPTLTVEVWRPGTLEDTVVHTGDFYVDTYVDLYGGVTSTVTTGTGAGWVTAFTAVIDSPAVAALLTQVRIQRISAEAVTLRLVAPAIADAFVTLRRGERGFRVQHGSTRPPRVATTRRVALTATPSLVGVAYDGRVQEDVAVIEGLFRWVAALDTATANAGSFSVTSPSVTRARFGAGLATEAILDSPPWQHRQLADASRQRIVTSAA